MAEQAIQRIKGVRQKNNNGQYLDFTPFGTDGRLIDMASKLDLQEELILGGNCETSIEDNTDIGGGLFGTIILQKYYYVTYTTINNEEVKIKNYTYSLKTAISNKVQDLIVVGNTDNPNQQLYLAEDQHNCIVDRPEMTSDNAIIEETLYKGEYDKENPNQVQVLHFKRITIYKGTSPQDNSVHIDGIVDP